MSVLDLLITNVQVYDGVTNEPRFEDVGVVGERIAYIGEDAAVAARSTIDADGLVLCPGFIDSHGSAGLSFLLPGASEHKLAQGVTTEIIGNDGASPAPVGPHFAAALEDRARRLGIDMAWRDFSQLAASYERVGLQQNLGCLAGHSTLRRGYVADWQRPQPAELEAMKSALVQAHTEGALGLSSGLNEAPGAFADLDELLALAQVTSAYGGLYVTHLRDERQGLEDAIEEAISIGRDGALPVLISHLKSAERPHWGRLGDNIRRLEEARVQGVRIAFEVYPYTAECGRLRTYLPKELMAEGLGGLRDRLSRSDWRHFALQWLSYRGTDFDAMTLVSDSVPNHDARGMSIAGIALAMGQEPADTLVDLVVADPEAWVVYHCLAEDDVDAAVLTNESIIGSASWREPVNSPAISGRPHPRTYGAFVRYLERYAISGLLSFGHAIRKITSYPADLFGLRDRGRIAVGACADLVLLNPNEVKEHATYADPRRLATGAEKVWVNGTLVFADGRAVDARPGRVLRRGAGA
ncbi:MAG: amidohydrolase family protein [Acidobacteriota bacterium]